MQPSKHSLHGLSALATAWGVVFAVVHVYWAAGGGAVGGGGGGDPSLGESIYIAVVALLGLLAAAVARSFARPWSARVGRRGLRALAGSAGFSLLAGVAVGIGRWIADGSRGGDGPGGVAITAYFLVGGILFAALAWRGRGSIAAGMPASQVPDGLSGRSRA